MEWLQKSGLSGEYPLTRMESFNAVQGSTAGSFFLGFGSVDGSLGSEFKIQFYWSPKPKEIIATTLPYSRFRFVIDETKDIPTVSFIFNKQWLFESVSANAENPINLNDIIMSYWLTLAEVRISTATLEKEVYLPKIN